MRVRVGGCMQAGVLVFRRKVLFLFLFLGRVARASCCLGLAEEDKVR